MATAQLGTVLRHLRRAVRRQDAAGRTDGQLLASFIDQKDDAVLEALVRHHGQMVYDTEIRASRQERGRGRTR